MANQTPRARVPGDSDPGKDHPPIPMAADPSAAVERVVLDDAKIRRALMRIAHEILESTAEVESLYLVAIPNGGVPLGRRLVENIESLSGVRPGMGILDTTLYRDDLATRGMRPRLRKTEMPSSVDDRLVILVEDVVNTGRTIRAAMDALMDFGRPRAVRVVALVDRGRRELPIKIDYVGKNSPTQAGETVVLHIGEGVSESGPGEESLEVVVRTQGEAHEADAGKRGRA
ncbi:MAG: bifunctional pyr operon transcriptional regulator/uracil phosphoribosyltransferase PyrR [Myxococcota bacterium]|nr:bifunctional pyr operon transcriptional regulator/uracil phosphoribosyltransferase PyrR [Myxococcota bacterium]